VKYTKLVLLPVVTCLLAACAGLETVVNPPMVSLTNVDVAEVGFSKQTFVLSFDVSNPNPFPLPVNHVSYGVKLDEQRFASGETVAAFTVPANSDSAFAISVDLDLLRTAPQLLYTVRDGTTRNLSYELSGKLGIDIPLVNRISFKHSGEIRLQSSLVTRATKR
jgi:LEA14-like dessication related protein